MSHVIEGLPSKIKALSSNPTITKKRKTPPKKKEGRKEGEKEGRK
jgi:hypothetical protein